MKIHQDGGMVTTAPSRKLVSFAEKKPTRHNGRAPLTPIRKNRMPIKSPHPTKSDTVLFKSPSTSTGVTSNNFRQHLKKGCTPSSTKAKIRIDGRDNEIDDFIHSSSSSSSLKPSQDITNIITATNLLLQNRSKQQHLKPLPKTSNSASALRRALRGTIQLEEKHQQQCHPSKQSGINGLTTGPVESQINKQVNTRLCSSSGNQPFLSRSTVITASSTYTSSSSLLVGRSRLIGKGGLASGRSSISCLGPPKRVEPKTPNSLLRTELEDEDDQFDESLLMSPPPGALWNTLNLSSGAGGKNQRDFSPTVTTGLIVVSPQAAEKIHTWSSAKNKLSSTPLPSQSSSLGTNYDRVSPAVPRALMQTPHNAGKKETITTTIYTKDITTSSTTFMDNVSQTTEKDSSCAVQVPSNECKIGREMTRSSSCTSLVTSNMKGCTSISNDDDACKPDQVAQQKATKGGIAMDLTHLFSPENNGNKLQQENQQEKKKIWTESTPLSSSVPVSLLSKLVSNKQRSSSRQAQKKEAQLPSSIPTASINSSKNRNKQEKSIQGKSKCANITTKPNRNDKVSTVPGASIATDISKIWKKEKVNQKLKSCRTKNSELSKKLMKKTSTQEKIVDEEAKCAKQDIMSTENTFDRSPSKIESTITCEQKSATMNHRRGLAIDVGSTDVEKPKTLLPSSRNRTLTVANPSTVITKEFHRKDCWAERQCESFMGWLNYTFYPEEMDIINEGNDNSLNSQNNIVGLRTLLIHRRLAASRAKALDLFQNNSMHQIRTIIVKEIARGKLSIRSDRDVTADVQLRKKLVSLLLSYTTPWLRMGLEVMFGECIEPVPILQNSSKTYLGRMKLALEFFIKSRFLSDDYTLEKFTKGRCNVPSGIFETRYKAQMRNLVLSRIMTLVFFLDRAKTCQTVAKTVSQSCPRLFTVSSEVKSSRDVLVTICRECLSSEGDIVKHLSRIGLKISYVQHPVDEISFKVNNLATDLRDGVLLTRLAEIVTGASFKTLMESLRLPVVSRLQKKFNVNLALSKIKDFGITIAAGINAHHIMDGHREKVLALMWCIIAHCCMEKLLQDNQVEQEIQNVIRSSQARKKIKGRLCIELEHVPFPHKLCNVTKDLSPDKILKDLLLRWSQAVCSSFGVIISDLNDSFANGKVLCLLIHYYHPSSILIDEILPTALELKNSHGEKNLNATELSENERSNWKNASKSMQQLGGIPDMLPVCDSRNPPDEQTMLLCLSYLCSRLMESSREIFATILIQACYRKYKKTAAARSIFRIWTLYKSNYHRNQKQRYKVAVATIENFITSHRFTLKQMKATRLKKELIKQSATSIQRVFRGKLGRNQYSETLKQHRVIIIIQSMFRQQLAMRFLTAQQDAAITIQCAFRRYVAHEVYLDYRFYIIELQRNLRGYFVRKEMKAREYAVSLIQQAWWSYVLHTETELAATCVQKIWRGILGRRKYIEYSNLHTAACSIQKIWRGYCQSLMYFIAVESSIVLQKMTRGFLARKANPIRVYRQSATSIQKIWRGFSVQVQFQIVLLDIVCIQSLARRKLAQRAYLERVDALSALQCGYRCFLARRKTIVKIEARIEERQRYQATVMIQSCARKLIVRQTIYSLQYSAFVIQSGWRELLRYRLMTSSATKIQAAYRVKKLRSMFLRSKKAVVDLQKYWRGYKSRLANEIQSFAATLIQCVWRRYWVYTDYKMFVKENESAILIQAHVRRMATRRIIDVKKFSARIIQRQWYRYLRFTLETYSATKIQAGLRRYWVYTDYKIFVKESESAILIQAHARRMATRRIIDVKKYSARIIQRQWHRHLQFTLEMYSATKIQAGLRSSWTKSHFLQLKNSVIVVQKIARARHAKKIFSIEQDKRQCEHAAISIQKIWRGFSKQVQFQMDTMDIICVQSISRKFLASRAYQRSITAASAIQRASRCAAARQTRSLRKLVLDTQVMNSVIKIQTSFRSRLMRSKFLMMKDASLGFQKCWRGHATRICLGKLRRCGTIIQSSWRMYQFRSNYLSLLDSATKIQCCCRLYLTRSRYFILKEAVIDIQRYWRGYATRELLARQSHVATMIQSHWRRSCAQKNYLLNLFEREFAATKIQSCCRLYLTRSRYFILKEAVIDTQRYWRGYAARELLAKQSHVATMIQSHWRRSCAQNNYLLNLFEREVAATKIQSWCRLYLTRSRYLIIQEAVIGIQQSWRGYATREILAKQSRVATMIQSHWRRSCAQNNYLLDLLEMKSATIIQASFRMYIRRMDYMVIKFAAHTIQRYTRGLLSRVDLAVKHFAASDIQRMWRGYCTYSFKTILHSAIKVQTVIRMASAKKQVGELKILYWAEKCYRNRNATIIQISYRKYVQRERRNMAANEIQKAFRYYSHLVRIQKASRGIVALQSLFRAVRIRNKRSKKVALVAHRVIEETRRAIQNPTMQLGFRTSRALEILQTSQSLTKIMDAVKELEASTRISVVCCQVFTKVNAANILLHLIQSCNRSVPHMELKEHILLTLENVAQYPSLVGSFAHYKYAEVFLDNIQVFRDKDGIFCLAVVLLDRIAKANQSEVGMFCATHENLKRLKEVIRVVGNRKLKYQINKNLSDKSKKLRKYGLAKRDDYERDKATRILQGMIRNFTELEIPFSSSTPKRAKHFDFE